MAGTGEEEGWLILRCSQQNFPCASVFPKSIAFVIVFPALFSFCSHVPKMIMAMFPETPGEPHDCFNTVK